MTRRDFVCTSGGAVLVGGGFIAADARQCNPQPNGLKACTLQVPKPTNAIVVQDCGERCWAASISFIFGYHGHPIHQDRISAATFGPASVAACIPASSSKTLVKVLDSDWHDDNGVPFHARISAAYDPANGLVSLDNNRVVAELNAGNPLLYCNRTHAMVQLGMLYMANLAGQVVGVDDVLVVDPWPKKGYRSLSPGERAPIQLGGEMTFLAAVTIS